MLCYYYKGRTSFYEMMNMPLAYIKALCNIANERQKTEEGKKQLGAEQLEDELEEAI